MHFDTTMMKRAALAASAAAALALSSTTAFADIACNRWHECWHVRDHYTNYPAELGIVFYGDDWREAHLHRYHWRHDRDDDRGYYRHGAWRPFD